MKPPIRGLEATRPGVSVRAASGDIRIGGRKVAISPHNCFACGELNAHGLRLVLHAQDDRCWTDVALGPSFEGWEGIAHGGIVCTLLDEVMAWALIGRDAWGLTARMSVDFKRPARIGEPLRAEGRVVEVRRRLMRTSGRLLEVGSGDVLATSDGLYLAASPSRREELKARYGFGLDEPSSSAAGSERRIDP